MKRFKQILCAVLVVFLALGPIAETVSAIPEKHPIAISELKVNNLVEPLGIDTTPRFRWMNTSTGFGKYQRAYQIIVASTQENAEAHTGDLWDSGKVSGEDNFDIPYAGAPLASRSVYYWAVRVWDEADDVSQWSAVARFGTGILDPDDWQGSWISARDNPFRLRDFNLTGANWIWYCNGVAINKTPNGAIEYFRKHITVNPNKTVANAYLAATCDDFFTLYVNGNQALDVPYKADGWKEGRLIDISQWLTAGDNVIAVKAVNRASWACFLAKLVICYTDGSWESISTDKSWLVSQTEQIGWMDKDFSDTDWVTADYALAYGSSPYYENVTLPLPTDPIYDFTIDDASWIWHRNGVPNSSTPANAVEYFRKHITVNPNKIVDRAYLAATCDDFFTLYINGNQALDIPFKADGWKEGQLIDISQWLASGDNVIAVKAVNHKSWACFLAKLVISYTDGTCESVSTDMSWLVSQTEQTGWMNKDFDDTAWVTADYALKYGGTPYGSNVTLPIPAHTTYDFDLTDANWVWYTNGTAISGTPAGTEYFRKKITVNTKKRIEKAYMAATCDDYFTFYINGEQATSRNFASNGWSSGRFCDVTELIHGGENLLAAQCTNYSAGMASFIGKLVVYYTDGSADTWVTDKTWKASKTKQTGWNTQSFDDSSWNTVDYAQAYGSAPYNTSVQLTFDKRVQKDIEDNSAPMLRKTFALDKEITSARMYIAGLGIFTLKINGTDPTDSVLNQVESHYSKTISYSAYDVTDFLRSGNNALAVELGNGFYDCPDNASLPWTTATWCSEPKLMLELLVEYADGTTQTIVSDDTWKGYSQGPMLRDSMFAGEIYDARKEIAGWDQTDFDDSGWLGTMILNAPKAPLTFAELEPMRKLEESKPTAIKKLDNGNYLVTFPKQTTGWAKIAFPEAAAGDQITITYTEKAHAQGVIAYIEKDYLLQQYTYICKGEDDVHEPKFSYVGFGYVEIAGYEGELTAEDITAYQIATDVERTGSFESGNEMVNSLHEIMVRTMVNNMQGKPTDTPVYEKIGWTGDYNAGMKCFNYNFDTSNFQPYFLGLLQDNTHSNGNVTRYSPSPYTRDFCPPCWNQAYINGVYSTWKESGLLSVVEEHYDTMRNLVAFYKKKMENHVWTDQTYGDWASPHDTTRPVEGGAFYSTAAIYRVLLEAAEMATALGKTADAKEYLTEAQAVYDAFNKTFYNEEKGYYETGYRDESVGANRTEYRQSVNLVPLYYGLCPDAYFESVLQSVIQDIKDKGYHLDTGCIGCEIILPLLSREGYGDLALKVLLQDTFPSWGYWVKNGATSCWEAWGVNGRSKSHYFLGTYDAWFYQNLAGIQNAAGGYKTVTIRPEVYNSLSYIDAEVKTVRGTLGSSWNVDGNSTKLTITVPVGTTADVLLPCASIAKVTVNGNTLAQQEGIVATGTRDGRVLVQVGSGEYVFEIDDTCPHCGNQTPDSGWIWWDRDNIPSGNLESGHYILDSDIQLAGALTVEADKTVVLDLNGHTLTAADGESAVDAYGNVVVSNGTIDGSVYMYTGTLRLYENAVLGSVAFTSGKLQLDNNWTGSASVKWAQNYTYGEELPNANAVCGTGATFASGGSYTGTLIYDGIETKPNLFGVNGSLVVAGAQVVGQTTRWVANNAAAVTAVQNGEYIKLYTDKALELTKDAYVDINGHTVSASGSGMLYGMNSAATGSVTATCPVADYAQSYLAIGNENVYNFYPIDMALSAVVLRPETAGVYYKVRYNCDSVVGERISYRGIAMSVASMPTENFENEGHVIYTKLNGAPDFSDEGVAENSCIVNNILTAETAAENDANGKTPIYARPYVAIDKDGDGDADYTVVAGLTESGNYSLLDVLKAIDGNWTFFEPQQETLKNRYNQWKNWNINWDLELPNFVK